MRWILSSYSCRLAALLAFATLLAAGAAAQTRTPEGVREHIEQADALVDTLLQRQHVITATGVNAAEAPPTNARNTLVTIDRSAVTRVGQLLDAILAMVPAHAQRSGPFGDVRAHAEKAREIVRELLPAGTTAQGALATVDRTALMRLDIEMDTMDELTEAP